MSKKRPILTYQTRIPVSAEQGTVLDAYAVLYGQAERSLFAALQSGKPLNELKIDFLKRFGLTARQFNAIRINLEGKIASLKERRPELIAAAGTRIKRAEKVIHKLAKMAPGSNTLHQKKRRLATLKNRLAAQASHHGHPQPKPCGCMRFRADYLRCVRQGKEALLVLEWRHRVAGYQGSRHRVP